MNSKNVAYAALIAASAALAVVGSTGSSAAAKMQTMGPFCGLLPHNPVCAVKGGHAFTYANSCFAANDGANIVYRGACHVRRVRHHVKHMMKKKKAPAKSMKKPMKKGKM